MNKAKVCGDKGGCINENRVEKGRMNHSRVGKGRGGLSCE